MSITRCFKFRLYPTKNQCEILQANLNACRWIYNKFVEDIHKSGFHTRNDLSFMLTELKQQEPWLYSYHSKMLQRIPSQLENAQKSLIMLKQRGYRTGKLRFANYMKYRTITYNQSGFLILKDALCLSKIGKIKMNTHRNIPDDGKIKQVSITRTKSEKWYVSIACEMEKIMPKTSFRNFIGIDLGIRNFVYDSNGMTMRHQKNLKNMLKPLKRIQRKISRRKNGSNRKKAIRRYQIIHERISNRRKDFLHKTSTHYAKNNDVVFVEKLVKMNLLKNHRIARALIDCGWGTFVDMLEYKCRLLMKVSPQNTSIICSRCGNPVPKTLAVRIHKCNICNLEISRDHNAAINILIRGFEGIKKTKHLKNLPQELWEVTPVEIIHRSLKQENVVGLAR